MTRKLALPLSAFAHSWRRWITPNAALPEEDAGKARILAALILADVVLCITFAIWSTGVGGFIYDGMILFIEAGLLLAAYRFTRDGRWRLGALLLSVVTSASVALLAIPTFTVNELYLLYYLILPIFLAGLFLRFALAFALAMGNIFVAALLVFLYSPPNVYEFIGGVLIFLPLATIFVLYLLRYWGQFEKKRRLKSEQIAYQLRVLADNSADIIGQVDHDFVIRYIGPSCLTLLGYPQETFVGYTLYERWIPHILEGDREKLAESFAHVTAETHQARFEYRFRHAAGHVLWLETVGAYIPGERAGITFVTRDVTERKQAELQLRYQASLLEIMADAVISTDQDFRIISWNRGAEAVYGWQAAEVIGRMMDEVTGVDYIEAPAEKVLARFMEQGDFEGEFIHRRKDGTRFDLYSRIRMIRDEAGKMIGAVAVNRDITERKRLREAMRQNEIRLRAIVENTSDAIFIKDLEGRYIFANPASGRSVHADPGSLLGKTDLEVFGPEVGAQIMEMDRRIIETGETLHYETTRTVNGVTLALDTIRFPYLSPAGEIIGVIGISRDVSERRKMEDALRDSDTKLRAIVDHAPDSIYIKDLEGRYLLANKAGMRGGYTVGEALGKTDAELFGNEIGQRVMAVDRRVMQSGEPLSYDTPFTDEEGAQRVMHTVKYPYRSAEGQIIGIIGITREITDSLRTEQALRESEARLRAIVENTTDAIYIKDRQGRYLLLNQAAAKHLSIEEMLGKTDEALFDPQDAQEIYKIDQQVMATGQLVAYESMRVVGQHEYTMHNVKFPYVGPDGEVIGLIGISRDLSERKRMERALQESEARYRLLLDTAPIATILLSTEGEILYANPAAARLAGLASSQDLTGRAIWSVLQTSDQALVRARMTELPLFEPFAQQDYTVTNYAGKRIEVEVHPVGITYQGSPAVLCLIQDVSERRRAHEQKRHLETERERVLLLRSIIADVSHDLVTPLTSLRLRYDLLRRASDPERQAKAIEALATPLQHLESQMQNLLTLSRLDHASSQTFSLQPCDLIALMCQIAVEEEEAARAKGQTLTLKTAQGELIVQVDPDELRRAIRHLLTNAISYTPDGGVVTVSVYAGPEAVIEISDTGIGIDSLDLANIFEPFFRADRARNIDRGGMGLGLSIARRIIEGHGGRIAVESAPGKGSAFRIHLPLPENAAAPPNAGSSAG